ncbi:MAG: SprT-like domain-containing protein [Ectothiorhodospira sp.]
MPLDAEHQRTIRHAVRRFFQHAAPRYGVDPTPPSVHFDLRGRAAGQWRVMKGTEALRFNPHLFAMDWERQYPDTVAHEVAHSIVYRRFGLGRDRRRPHGPEWREVMASLGFEPRVTHDSDLTGVPVRRTRRYPYRCACQVYALGARRHRSAQSGERIYYCRRCGQTLVHAPEATLPGDAA